MRTLEIIELVIYLLTEICRDKLTGNASILQLIGKPSDYVNLGRPNIHYKTIASSRMPWSIGDRIELATH